MLNNGYTVTFLPNRDVANDKLDTNNVLISLQRQTKMSRSWQSGGVYLSLTRPCCCSNNLHHVP
jgi:hypothetical protein